MSYTPLVYRDFLTSEAAEYCGVSFDTFRHYTRANIGIIKPDGKLGRNNTYSKKVLDAFKKWYKKNGRPRISAEARAAEAARLFDEENMSSAQVAERLRFDTPAGAWRAAQRHRARLAKQKP